MRSILSVALILAACSGPKPDAPAVAANDAGPAAAAPTPEMAENSVVPAAAPAKLAADYAGRWIGVEGTYLTVTARDGGGVSMEMQYDLDNKGTFEGAVTPEGLRFIRNGVTEVARPSDGDVTGLKWLAGKTDCLTVKSGEGYCRK